jgi:hypothetical protein
MCPYWMAKATRPFGRRTICQARLRSSRTRIAEYDAEISQYRASLKAGGDPALIGPWIAETQAKKVAAQAGIRTATGQRSAGQPEDFKKLLGYGSMLFAARR